MSVSIKAILEEPKQKWYTNHDILRGHVTVQTKNTLEVSKVVISLVGVSETKLTRVDDYGQKFTDRVDDLSILLNMEQQVFPPQDYALGTNYSIKAGEHSWPYEFVIPDYTSGLEHCPLPPSLSDLDSDTGYIKYYIEAVVHHSSSVLGIGSNAGINSTRIPLVFLPTDGSSLDNLPTYGMLHCQQSRVVSSSKTVSGVLNRLVTSIGHDNSSKCSNIGEFSVSVELLLTPSVDFSWTVSAISNGREDLVITGIKVKLKLHTDVRAKNVNKSIDKAEVLYEKSHIELTAGNLTAQLGNPPLRIPECTPPSFQAPNLRREYSLELRITWCHRQTSNLIHKAYLERKVFVRSGMQALPNYETGDVVRPDRDYPQAKWYFR